MSKAETRKTSFWNSDLPITSKQARIILSNQIDAENLVDAIRRARSTKSTATFTLSEETVGQIIPPSEAQVNTLAEKIV